MDLNIFSPPRLVLAQILILKKEVTKRILVNDYEIISKRREL